MNSVRFKNVSLLLICKFKANKSTAPVKDSFVCEKKNTGKSIKIILGSRVNSYDFLKVELFPVYY